MDFSSNRNEADAFWKLKMITNNNCIHWFLITYFHHWYSMDPSPYKVKILILNFWIHCFFSQRKHDRKSTNRHTNDIPYKCSVTLHLVQKSITWCDFWLWLIGAIHNLELQKFCNVLLQMDLLLWFVTIMEQICFHSCYSSFLTQKI